VRLGQKKDEIQVMNSFHIKFFSLSGCILLWLLASQPSGAEIVPDTTLPNNSIVTPNCTNCKIEGGTTVGNNLFHSFEKFSIPTGGSAEFNNVMTIENIITRVTGKDISNIDGLISASDKANVFLLNPSGIIFGINASLNIGGSFIASTASSLKFADGTEFRTNAPQTTPLLTINVPMGLQVPTGLQFGSNPGEIVNKSQASPNNALNILGLPVGLQVKSGRTLALVGGNVSLEYGNLTAGDNLTEAGGRIELGSVASGSLVNLSEIETGYALGYAGVKNFGDIQLSPGADSTKLSVVDASGSSGGAIQLQGRNINLTGNSLIYSINSGSHRGGDLTINASASVKLSGGSQIGTYAQGVGQAGDVKVTAFDSVELEGKAPDGTPSFLGSQVCPPGSSNCQSVTGNGGNLTIETGKLLVRDGAIIDSSTFGAGKAGNIIVTARDAIELTGAKSGIFAQVADKAIDNAGDAGTLTIETKQLTVFDGAQISTAARKTGNGGNLTIKASDSIQLSGTAPLATAQLDDKNRSGIFVSAESESRGNVGNLNLTTGLLSVESGARISADNLGTGQGGSANLNVRQLVIRNGGEVRAGSFAEGTGGTLTVNATDSVQVIGTGTIASKPVNSTLSAQAQASGKAGGLNITTPSLKVQDGGEVTVSSTGTGTAGNLTVTADRIELDNQGKLISRSQVGADAGNITLNLKKSLFLRHQSEISTSAGTAEAPGNGGNIVINAPNGFVVAIPKENSDITANASRGNGGNVTINSKGIFGIERRDQLTDKSDITVSSEFGVPGNINLTNPENDGIQNSLTELPQNLINSEMLIASSCVVRGNERNGTFFITGSGGLPYRPGDAVPSAYPTGDVQSVADDTSTTKPTRRWKIGDPLIEPTGVYRLVNGQRILSRECGR
jgi:filamentous hemagglutinin family protein